MYGCYSDSGLSAEQSVLPKHDLFYHLFIYLFYLFIIIIIYFHNRVLTTAI